MGRVRCMPVRYVLAVFSAINVIYVVGMWKTFAVILTHVATSISNTTSDQEIVFSNCRALNSSDDVHVEMGEDTMFLVHSSFGAGFFLMRIPTAVLATRISPVRMVGMCLALSCLITVFLPFVITSSLPLLFFLRFVQGALDGSIHPCSVEIMSAWTTEADQGLLFGIAFGGLYLAPAVAAILSGLFICYVRWDGAFFVLGMSGIAFSVVWTRTAYNTPEDHPSLSLEERDLHSKERDIFWQKKTQTTPSIPWRHILMSLPVWSVFMGYFCREFLYTITIEALAQYFTDVFRMNIGDISLLVTLPHVGLTVVCLLGGVVVDKLLSFGFSLTLTRKIMFTVGILGEGLSLMGLRFTKDWRVAVTLITVGVSVGGLTTSGYPALPADLTPTYTGVVSGVASTGAMGIMVSAVVASVLVGKAEDESGWQQLFLVAGLVSITGALFFSTFAEAKHQPWSFGFASSPAEDGDVDLKSAPSEKDKLLPETKI